MSADPAGCGHLRASHIDREHAVGMLRAAFVQGRLTKDEFDARVGQALTARTYAELAALAADLPAGLLDAAPLRGAARGPARPRRKAARTGVRWPAAGLLGGILFAALQPPTFTATANLLTSSRYGAATQVVIASSDPVMAGALHRLDPGGSVQGLRSRVQVKSLTNRVISVSVQGDTPAQAVLTANAVTHSYLRYVRSITPPGPGPAWVINLSSGSVEQPRTTRLLVSAGLGTLLGALVGALGAAFRRRGRRFGIR